VQFAPHFVALNKKVLDLGVCITHLMFDLNVLSAMNDVPKVFNWRVPVMLSKNVQFKL